MPFPVELFQLVVELSPTASQRTFLFVCKMFHDLAVPVLFSRITLRFGIRRHPGRQWDLSGKWTVEESAQLDACNARSLSILHHIVSTPAFATAVRGLSIKWYEFPGPEHSTPQLLALSAALDVLTLLERFEWRGSDVKMPRFVAEALLNCPCLRTILIPPLQALWSEFTQLRKLSTITLFVSRNEWLPSVVDSMSIGERESIENALQLVEQNAASLMSLTASYNAFPRCALPNLQDATLIHASTCAVLDTLMQHSHALTALTLTVDSAHLDAFLAALAAAPAAFPQLTAFKFLVDYTRDPHDCDANPVVSFLRGKTHLRRLHLNLYSELSQPVIRMLPELPHLEVLGVGWGGMMFRAENAHVFDRCLPPNLRALSVNIEPGSVEALHALMAMLRRRPDLTVCYVRDPGDLKEDLVQTFFDDPLQTLEFVGCKNVLRYTCRPDTTRSRHGLSSRCRSHQGRTREDWGLDGWLWLAEHFVNLGPIKVEILDCHACGTTATSRRLLDCVDLGSLEGSCYTLDSSAFGL